MCVVSLKFVKDLGWIGGKNRDRNYEPQIKIQQSFRDDIERILLWDDDTKWTEGLNEYGVSILNATLMVIKDEKEGGKSSKSKSTATFYSPGGKAVRTALLEKTPKLALDKLIELETEGNSIVFDSEEAYILEGSFDKDKYVYKFIKCDKDKGYARTNHGLLIKDAGYPKDADDEYMKTSRQSSESRLKVIQDGINAVSNVDELFALLSSRPHKDYILNPIRISKEHGDKIMCTTGQIVLVPKDKTLYYRPIWCKTQFDFDKVNSLESKTFFEIISSRKIFQNEVVKEGKIVSFKEFKKRLV